MVFERVSTPKTIPTPSTIPTAVSRVRCTLARRFRKLRRFTGHRQKEILATIGVVLVDVVSPEAGSFVDQDRTLVERRHGECEALRRVTPSRELEPCK